MKTSTINLPYRAKAEAAGLIRAKAEAAGIILSKAAAAARRSALHIALIGAAVAIFGIAVDSRAILFSAGAAALTGAWLADSAKKGGAE